jgi:hypothetical protein
MNRIEKVKLYTLTYPHLTIESKKNKKMGFNNSLILNILEEAYKQFIPKKIETKRIGTTITYVEATQELVNNFNKLIDEHNKEFNLEIPHLEFNK